MGFDVAQRPAYTLDQIVDLFSLDLPMIRPRDLKRIRTGWRLYLGYDAQRRCAIKISAPGKLTRAEAWEKLQPQVMRYLQGRLPAMIILKGWSEKWLDIQTCRPSTKSNYRSLLNRHILPALGHLKLKDLTPSNIRQFLCGLQVVAENDRLAPKSINECLMVIRAMLRAAVNDDLLHKSPAAGVKRIPVQKERVEAFTTEEIKALLVAAASNFPRWYPPILHAFLTGQRAGEIWAQRWTDMGKDKILVERSVRAGVLGGLKDHESRLVDYPSRLRSVLGESSAYHSPLRGEWLYTTEEGGRVDHDNFSKRVWKKLMRAAEVRPLKFHCLRHSYASHQLRIGTSLEKISRELGHSTLEFTFRTYCHFLPASDDRSCDRLAEALGV